MNMNNDELIPWTIPIQVGGALAWPEAAIEELPPEIIEQLTVKIAQYSGLHDGQYAVRLEQWGQGWLRSNRIVYGWHPIFLGERNED